MCEYMYIFERVFSCFYAFYSPSRSRLALQVDSSFFSILLLTLLRFLSAIRISYLSLHDRSAGYIYIVFAWFLSNLSRHIFCCCCFWDDDYLEEHIFHNRREKNEIKDNNFIV